MRRGWTTDTAKEHLNEKIEGDRRSTRERFAFLLALALFAWFEIQRRLENLNHEAERIKQAQNASVSADTYRSDEARRSDERDDRREWEKTVDSAIGRATTSEAITKERKNEQRSGSTFVVAVVSVAVAVIVAAVVLATYIQSQ